MHRGQEEEAWTLHRGFGAWTRRGGRGSGKMGWLKRGRRGGFGDPPGVARGAELAEPRRAEGAEGEQHHGRRLVSGCVCVCVFKLLVAKRLRLRVPAGGLARPALRAPTQAAILPGPVAPYWGMRYTRYGPDHGNAQRAVQVVVVEDLPARPNTNKARTQGPEYSGYSSTHTQRPLLNPG